MPIIERGQWSKRHPPNNYGNKLNVGYYRKDEYASFCSRVFRDCKGVFVMGYSATSQEYSPPLIEADAILLGLQRALTHHIDITEIDVTSPPALVNAINRKTISPWFLTNFVIIIWKSNSTCITRKIMKEVP